MTSNSIVLISVSESDLNDLQSIWGDEAAHHFHLDDGFMISANSTGKSVGLISSCWRNLPAPLSETRELYIDFLEVRSDFRRKGIARQLIERTFENARHEQVYQVRSWSSVDKNEAIPMWKSLGFSLCPTTTFPQGKEVRGFYVIKVIG